MINFNSMLKIDPNKVTLIAGPCVIESEDMSLQVSKTLKNICTELDINYIFKSSFDKANRSSITSYRGVGINEGLRILKKVKDEVDVLVTTDVHEPWQCEPVASVVDIIQIPALLARQTDLIVAAAKTGKPINVKKGQFMAPWDMKNVISKIVSCGNEKILLCERGSSFGYNNLVVDMTSLVEMKKYGYPIVFDATHSVQKPSSAGTTSGGNREYIFPLMRAAIAIGVDMIFAEVHPDPKNALCDGANQIKLDEIREILELCVKIDKLVKGSI